jgi:hypothetical protein
MAGPGDMAAEAGRGRLRASHADREQVVSMLKTAFVQGRLRKDELDARVGLAFASRTYMELAALTADLPPGLAAAEPLQPARAQGERPVLPPGRVLAAATALYADTWAYGLLLSPHIPLAVPLIFSGSVAYLGILIICVVAILINWRNKHAGEQPPRRPGVGGPGSRRPASADLGGQVPPVDPGHWHTAVVVLRHRSLLPLRVPGHCAGGALMARPVS